MRCLAGNLSYAPLDESRKHVRIAGVLVVVSPSSSTKATIERNWAQVTAFERRFADWHEEEAHIGGRPVDGESESY